LISDNLPAYKKWPEKNKKGESEMKKLIAVLSMLSLVLVLSCQSMGMKQSAVMKPEEIKKESVVKVTATVIAVDLQNRIVTLKGENGNIVDVIVGDDVKNLSQVKAGDQLVVSYKEAVSVKILKSSDAVPLSQNVSSDVKTAELGQKPAGTVTEKATITAVITAIDASNSTVTLKGPSGNLVTVKVNDPANIQMVKVGDEVVITYTQALAISIEAPKGK